LLYNRAVLLMTMDLERFQHAISLRDSGKLEEAASELRSMVEESPNAPAIERGLLWINEEACLVQLGRFEEARHSWGMANELLKECAEVRLLVEYDDACLCMSERKPEDAFRKFKSMLTRHAEVLKTPEESGYYREIQLRHGLLLVELKRYREARPIMEEVLALDVEKDGAFYFSLGICYLALHEKDLARQQFCEALRLGLPDEKLVDSHFYLGVAYFRMRAYAKALQEFEFCEANIRKSTLPLRGLYKWLALTCRNLDLREEAKRYFVLSKV
ncbi:MAG: tetratricopeptide repeat protein, partial [Candidatus Acidiferrales bacterium]